MDFAVIVMFLCSASFSVEDPPDENDTGLTGIANFMSSYLKDDVDFFNLAAELVDKATARNIQRNANKPTLKRKCLELLESWIQKETSPKWQNLIPAANKSGFNGLARDLTKELGSQPLHKSVKKLDTRSPHGGKYKHVIYVYYQFLCDS